MPCVHMAWIKQAEASPFVADQIKTGVFVVHGMFFSRSQWPPARLINSSLLRVIQRDAPNSPKLRKFSSKSSMIRSRSMRSSLEFIFDPLEIRIVLRHVAERF